VQKVKDNRHNVRQEKIKMREHCAVLGLNIAVTMMLGGNETPRFRFWFGLQQYYNNNYLE